MTCRDVSRPHFSGPLVADFQTLPLEPLFGGPQLADFQTPFGAALWRTAFADFQTLFWNLTFEGFICNLTLEGFICNLTLEGFICNLTLEGFIL